ncbi:hypothetical protein Vafri_6772 [Volvox africanus]|uniref:Peptidase M11 gametolysin domain-containing protein n=1 Tax=Volvox africanus TaxID=51714 RepID=A0A8J4AZS3_9CHLO|nr:hypothetical protein Vafri_6772 [Volvox africanus]
MAARSSTGLAPTALAALVCFGFIVLLPPACYGEEAANNDSGQRSLLFKKEALKLRRPPRLPPNIPDAPEPPSSPSPVKYLEGELDVIISERETLITVLRHANGYPTSVIMEKAEALQYAGQLIRVRVVEDTPSTSETETSSSHLMALSNDNGAVRVTVVQSFGYAGKDEDIPKEEIAFRQPMTIHSIIYLVSACNSTNYFTEASFRKFWVNGPSTKPLDNTMQNYFSYCSQGAASMTNATQHVFEVTIPCTGSLKGFGLLDFDLINYCGISELSAYQYYAESYAMEKYPQLKDLDYVKQRIVVMPEGLGGICAWGGAASLGCEGTRCHVWIVGRVKEGKRTYMHEMLHNFYLDHSGREGFKWEYADDTCVMGSGDTCLNAANAWHMGWIEPVPGADLNGSTLLLGRKKTFVLPNQNQAVQSIIRVYPTWSFTGTEKPDAEYALANAYYISFRFGQTNFESFSTQPWDYRDNRVYVYAYQGTRHPSSWVRSSLKAMLGPNETYMAPMPVGLVVRVNYITANASATVTVCRSGGPNEAQGGNSCADGLDNDCDGLVDYDDPDCNGVLPSPSPPPPPPSPSPPKPRSPPPSPRPPPRRPPSPRPPSPTPKAPQRSSPIKSPSPPRSLMKKKLPPPARLSPPKPSPPPSIKPSSPKPSLKPQP